MSVNKVILVGNVGKDPEIRMAGDKKVANFSFATSEKYKNETTTEWHNVVIWDKLAEIVEKYVKKGSQLYLEGRIKTRSWEDKNGSKRYTTEVVMDTMKMLGGNKKTDSEVWHEETYAKDKGGQNVSSDVPDDDLPF